MDSIEQGNEERQFQENLKQIETNKEQIKQLDDELVKLSENSAYANMSADDRAKAILGISNSEVKDEGTEVIKTFEELLSDIERERNRGNLKDEQYYSQNMLCSKSTINLNLKRRHVS